MTLATLVHMYIQTDRLKYVRAQTQRHVLCHTNKVISSYSSLIKWLRLFTAEIYEYVV